MRRPNCGYTRFDSPRDQDAYDRNAARRYRFIGRL